MFLEYAHHPIMEVKRQILNRKSVRKLKDKFSSIPRNRRTSEVFTVQNESQNTHVDNIVVNIIKTSDGDGGTKVRKKFVFTFFCKKKYSLHLYKLARWPDRPPIFIFSEFITNLLLLLLLSENWNSDSEKRGHCTFTIFPGRIGRMAVLGCTELGLSESREKHRWRHCPRNQHSADARPPAGRPVWPKSGINHKRWDFQKNCGTRFWRVGFFY